MQELPLGPDSNDPIQKLKCNICKEFAIEAVTASCCNSLFCNPCISYVKAQNPACPKCGANGYNLSHAHEARNLISVQPIGCPMDCGATIKRQDLEEHKKKCPSHIYQCPRKECSFQGNFTQYTDHIINTHTNDIVSAFEEKQLRKKFTKSGAITGYYRQGGETPINGTFEMFNGSITLHTSDIVGNATWTGSVDVNSRMIDLVKQYHGAHSIYYRGRFDENLTRIKGQWGWDFSTLQDSFELIFSDQ